MEKRARKLFVKLCFRSPPSQRDSSHRSISTESRLVMHGIRNFRCFSSKIQQTLKIKIFDLHFSFGGFSKFRFQRSGIFSHSGLQFQFFRKFNQNFGLFSHSGSQFQFFRNLTKIFFNISTRPVLLIF